MRLVEAMKAAFFLIFTTSCAFAQSQETPVYVEQFANLQSGMKKIYSECSQNPTTAEERLSLSDRLFALTKIVHRLEEQVQEADLQSRQQGHAIDKRLRLIEQGSHEVDSVLKALGNYLDTDDRVFWGLAVDFRKTIDTIMKVL